MSKLKSWNLGLEGTRWLGFGGSGYFIDFGFVESWWEDLGVKSMQGIEDSISGSISSGFRFGGFRCWVPDFRMSSNFIAMRKGSWEWSRNVEFFDDEMLVFRGLDEITRFFNCLEGVVGLNSKFDFRSFEGVLLYLEFIYY